MEQLARMLCLKINAIRTTQLNIATGNTELQQVDGKIIEHVYKFTDLDSIVVKTDGMDSDIEARIKKAKQAFVMRNNVCKSRAYTQKIACLTPKCSLSCCMGARRRK